MDANKIKIIDLRKNKRITPLLLGRILEYNFSYPIFDSIFLATVQDLSKIQRRKFRQTRRVGPLLVHRLESLLNEFGLGFNDSKEFNLFTLDELLYDEEKKSAIYKYNPNLLEKHVKNLTVEDLDRVSYSLMDIMDFSNDKNLRCAEALTKLINRAVGLYPDTKKTIF